MRIGIVGCGRISQTYVAAIKDIDRLELTAVYDPRPEAAQATAEAIGAAPYTDLASFVNHDGLDAAVICAPPNVHREIAEVLMRRGVHVLCEKPFGTNYEDAAAMAEVSDATGVTLMMASKFRYAEDVIRAKSMITSGMLGQVLFYDNCFSGIVNMRNRWNSDPKVAGGGVIIDNGTHSVDIARYLFGPIDRVFAFEGARPAGLDVEDSATVSFITKNEIHGTIRLSWGVQVDSPSFIEITGTEGALRVGWSGSQYQRSGRSEWVSFGVGYDKIGSFRDLVQNFVGTILGTKTPLISMEEGLSSVAVIDAAYKSMESGSWVEVREPSRLPLQIAAAK